MLFGGTRLGFWKGASVTLGFTPATDPIYWSSNQFPSPIANSYAEFRFNPDGTITLYYTGGSSPLYSYPNNWATGTVTGSDYEIRATMNVVDNVGSGYYELFGGSPDTPTLGNSTSWYDLGTMRTVRARLSSSPGAFDYEAIIANIQIGLAGTSTALIYQNFQIDIGAI